MSGCLHDSTLRPAIVPILSSLIEEPYSDLVPNAEGSEEAEDVEPKCE